MTIIVDNWAEVVHDTVTESSCMEFQYENSLEFNKNTTHLNIDTCKLEYILGEFPHKIRKYTDIYFAESTQSVTDYEYHLTLRYNSNPFQNTLDGIEMYKHIFEDQKQIDYAKFDSYKSVSFKPTHIEFVQESPYSPELWKVSQVNHWKLYSIKPTPNGNYKFIIRQRECDTPHIESLKRERLRWILWNTSFNCVSCNSVSKSVEYYYDPHRFECEHCGDSWIIQNPKRVYEEISGNQPLKGIQRDLRSKYQTAVALQ